MARCARLDGCLGTAFGFVFSPGTALYWYVFSLFGIAVPYVFEVRREGGFLNLAGLVRLEQSPKEPS